MDCIMCILIATSCTVYVSSSRTFVLHYLLDQVTNEILGTLCTALFTVDQITNEVLGTLCTALFTVDQVTNEVLGTLWLDDALG